MSRLRLALLLFAGSLALVAGENVLGVEAAKPLNKKQIFDLLQGGVSARRMVSLLEQRGIDFEPNDQDLEAMKEAKANETVLDAVRSARQVLPKEVMLARHRTRAKELENRGSPAEAESEYRAALQIEPTDPALHTGLGNALAQQKKWDGSIAAFRQALRLKPQDPETHFRLGLALRQNGDQVGAINAWSEALKYRQDDPRVFEELGRVFTERRDWRRATIAYRGLARLKPEGPVHLNLGVVLRNGGDSDGALAAFREAVRLSPNDPIAHNNLGYALEEKGDIQTALEQYQLAVQLSPQDPAIKTNLDRAAQKLKRPSLVSK